MLKTRYWGPFKQEWYSICSAHQQFQEGCSRCSTGMWINVWLNKIDSYMYHNQRFLWLRWHNRPKSNFNKFMKNTFPKWNSQR